MTPQDSTMTGDPTRRKEIIGLVGGIGAGKSTVAERFRQLGASVIDADRAGHEALLDPAVIPELTAEFGPGILDGAGQVDRTKLADVVFADPARRKKLEAIVHPRMMEMFQDQIRKGLDNPAVPLVVLDAAILFETGWNDACDRIVYVDAPRSVRLERLRATRGWSEAELARRESSQWPVERKKERADEIIDNGTTAEACIDQVDRVFRKLVEDSPDAPPHL